MVNEFICTHLKDKRFYDPDFWIARLHNADEILMDDSEIKSFNHLLYKKMVESHIENYYYDFSNPKNEITAYDFINEIEKVMPMENSEKIIEENLFIKDGGKIRPLKKDKLKDFLSNFQDFKKGISGNIQVSFGLITDRSDLKALPFKYPLGITPNYPFHDITRLTTLSPGEPILIYRKSFKLNWYFVQSSFYSGWINIKNLTAVSKKEFFDYNKSPRTLIVMESKVCTEDVPAFGKFHFQMGDKLVLANEDEINSFYFKMNTLFPEGCYPVKIPLKRKLTNEKYGIFPIPSAKEVKASFPDLTQKNLIKQAFKMVGERYGWGGSDYNRDCSRFIMDIFKCFGVYLPRDSKYQEIMTPAERTSFPQQTEERKIILDGLKTGDILFMKGHVMMYLGKFGNEYYVIHQGAGFKQKKPNGDLENFDIHGTFIMPLSVYTLNSSTTYLDSLSSAVKITQGLKI
ncbi:NlpC/P60 family protein [Petrotoga olearia]|uniref:Glycoside hydrolase n=2 Tax=Petrotoga olearia TaxID=156203 RepID=A0A2K1P734_9BACT|nr:NlpC/P60 family protein [Petrotoga olearia]PNR98605.1 hypothetical protein X929_00090 [Petrotoga olearia DSM 13574]RMA69322.1 SH3 domain containing protein [Petrotoga olearia]